MKRRGHHSSTRAADASSPAPLPTDRRAFLERMTAGAAVLVAGAVAGAAPASLAAEAPWGTGVESGARAPWSDAWLDRIAGKHKQFFDGVTFNDGFVLLFADNFLNLNHEAYGLSDKDLTAVVGFRHFSMPMALNDDMWAKYKLGEAFKVTDPVTKAPAVRNPFAHRDGVKFAGSEIPALVSRGVIFTVCNVALTVISGMMAGNGGVTADQAKQEWTEQLIPGMTLVPVGVIAVNRAQERGCTYCYGG